MCSAGPRRLFGLVSERSSIGEETGVGLSSSCDRFTRLGGGGSISGFEMDFELERCAREPIGTWTPSDSSDNDFRRVL